MYNFRMPSEVSRFTKLVYVVKNGAFCYHIGLIKVIEGCVKSDLCKSINIDTKNIKIKFTKKINNEIMYKQKYASYVLTKKHSLYNFIVLFGNFFYLFLLILKTVIFFLFIHFVVVIRFVPCERFFLFIHIK